MAKPRLGGGVGFRAKGLGVIESRFTGPGLFDSSLHMGLCRELIIMQIAVS